MSKQFYEVQCSWTMVGTYIIEATSEGDAIQQAHDKPALPSNTGYVSGSFKVDEVRKESHIELENFSNFEIKSEDGKFTVEWEWIGEGNSGDYNPSDPDDKPRLRFCVYDDKGEQLEDASYCTYMTPEVPRVLLEIFAENILEVVASGSYYKRRLGQLTWTTEAELVQALGD